MLKRVFDSPYAFWVLLALPSLYLVKEGVSFQASYRYPLFESGPRSGRPIVVPPGTTPPRMPFQGWPFPRLAMRGPPLIGVAGIGHAPPHFFFFLAREGD